MIAYRGIKTLEVLEGADNYNAWIAEKFFPYIKTPALEIGAGTGNISSFFTEIESLVLTDNDSKLVKFLANKFVLQKNVRAEVLDIASKFGEVKNKFKTIYAINVLEHIKDDNLALKNIGKLLVPNGKIILLVPAKKFAYTKLDKSLGHYRRYERQELVEKLERSGFKVEKVEYFNVLGLLSWLIRDRISRNHNQLKKSQVKVFDAIVPLLRKIEPTKNLPFGISLIAVARRR